MMGSDGTAYIVSTHSRLKAAGCGQPKRLSLRACFNTQPPEGGWALRRNYPDMTRVSTHSRLKAAGKNDRSGSFTLRVSTHSRLKAAGQALQQAQRRRYRFNTQPPEGGWPDYRLEGLQWAVSTHSRLKAAGAINMLGGNELPVSTHSRLKAAGYVIPPIALGALVSTHSRLKAAGPCFVSCSSYCLFQHTAA